VAPALALQELGCYDNGRTLVVGWRRCVTMDSTKHILGCVKHMCACYMILVLARYWILSC